MNQQKYFLLAATFLCAVLLAPQPAAAKIMHKALPAIPLAGIGKDITFSRDGSTVYILGKNAIMLYSVPESKVTDTIPLTKPYSAMALSPDESTFYLTAADAPQIDVIEYAKINIIEIGKSPVIGPAAAPVTITAFFDFQCPYCAKAYPLLQELLKKYPRDIKLVIKHYPLPMHKFGVQASTAALAAARQNKYEKVTELLFNNFSKLNDATIRSYAQEAGLDMQKFDSDIASPEIKEILLNDKLAARQVGVRGVPAIFINGIKPRGRSVEAFSQMVEEELNKKK